MSGCHDVSLSGADFARPNARTQYAPDLGVEPVHIDLALRFDVAGRRAEGAAVTTFAARRADRRSVVLDAVDLRGVAVEDPDGHEVRWSYDGRRIRVSWHQPLAAGERRRLAVSYRVEDPLTGMLFSGPDADYPDRPLFVVTDHETERARYWLPCVDHPAVRTTLDLHLQADAELTILGNGSLVNEETHADGTKTAHWRLEHPCPSYLVCVGVGDFVRADLPEHAGIPVAAFAPRTFSAEDLRRSFGRTTEMLDWMTAKLDHPFPFPKYFQVAVPQIGGAMENISLVTWDDAFVLDATLAREWSRLVDRINVHEMAHSYFGDAIVMRDFAHAWLKESWATYMECVWFEDQEGEEELDYQLHVDARRYMDEADQRYVRPIVTHAFDSSWDMFDAHLYPGGAWRIHMLRRKVGDEAFWAGVRDYVKTYAGRTVETEEFRRKLEEHSGLSLGRFFEQWLYKPGYPKLKVAFEHDAERGEAKLTVKQEQVDAKQGVGLFDLDLEVAFETGPGEWTRRTFELREREHSLVLPLAARPLQVVVDPGLDLLCGLDFDPGLDMLRRSLSDCPHLSGRLHAARTLARSGKAQAVDALRAAYPQEGFWGGRVAIASALGEANSRAAALALAELVLREEDPRVLGSVAEACGSYREPAVAAALRELLDRDLPYQARAAALRSLGKQRDEAHVDALAAAADDPSWWGWVRRGAMAGLGSTRSERARRLLSERVAYGRDLPQVRQAAIPALAEAARWQETGAREQTAELLADLARDPEYRVRQVTAAALADLGEPQGVSAIGAIARSVAEQDQPRVRRQAERLRRKARGAQPGEKLQKRVEELEDELRKAKHRLDVLEGRAAVGGEERAQP